jgi:hypothetical protein
MYVLNMEQRLLGELRQSKKRHMTKSGHKLKAVLHLTERTVQQGSH